MKIDWDAHWRQRREEYELNDRAELEQLAAECPPATAGPSPAWPPYRGIIPKERMDEIADKIFGPDRIPQARPVEWLAPWWWSDWHKELNREAKIITDFVRLMEGRDR